ncbi:uncharacterized protein LOC133977850 isoform X2 [Scomber scombrus]|uniref:uncharacterized protein LOC133977850 isoform X2 n=1 Tax=Scomber scombrus TaxID=13677 RepID=UPI002DDC4545|nr:uncharacterized protein LOC133977850 isoform X2 [Scomber scombrus]
MDQRTSMVKSASAHAGLQEHQSDGVHRKSSPVSSFVPQPDYEDGDEDDDLIKPKKLINPVVSSKSHQELHRELLSSCRRSDYAVCEDAARQPARTAEDAGKVSSPLRVFVSRTKRAGCVSTRPRHISEPESVFSPDLKFNSLPIKFQIKYRIFFKIIF